MRHTVAVWLGIVALGATSVTVAQGPPRRRADPPRREPRGHDIEQAISDRAQITTIAFDGLAFLTGSLGADSFFPPGKVADLWGFQYLRDNDPTQMGHNTGFLTSAAFNMLHVLTPDQRSELIDLGRRQVTPINEYARGRFTLMRAFRRLLEGDLPVGTTGLDREAVSEFSARLYRLDGQISLERAEVMGGILSALDSDQRGQLDAMAGQGMRNWPDVDEPSCLRGLPREVKQAAMTYAGDMLSWYLGSVEADVYFCPERHGTYFGSFYLKAAPAMGNRDFTIGSNITGDSGTAFLEALTPSQRELMTDLLQSQRSLLEAIVTTRREVSEQLRRFITGEQANTEAVMSLMERYGQIDGELVFSYATTFAAISASLSAEQTVALASLREQLGVSIPRGAFLYSSPINVPPNPDTDFLFE